jgi:hypothetical protein
MAVFVKMMCLGKCTGVSFIDSTPIRACTSKEKSSIKPLKISLRRDNVLWVGFNVLSSI